MRVSRPARPWPAIPLLAAVSVAGVLGLYLYTAFIEPRPYYIVGGSDLEHDYYYNARLWSIGQPVSIHHPGTPVYYLAYLLLRLTGESLDAVQAFFSLGYFVLFLFSALSLTVFITVALRRETVPPALAALAVASIIGWPSFLTSANYFGSDGFVFLGALLTITAFWRTLEAGQPLEHRGLVFVGMGMGVSLAIKMSFLPVAVALALGSACHVLRAKRGSAGASVGRQALSLGGMSAAAVGAYAVCMLPVIRRLPELWIATFSRSDVSPPPGQFATAAMSSVRALTAFNPFLVLLAGGAIVWLLWIGFEYGYRLWGSRGRRPSPIRLDDGEFDYAAAGLFIVILMAGFGYTMAVAGRYFYLWDDTGYGLRNVAPTALFLPFLLLYCHRLGGVPWDDYSIRGKRVSRLLTIGALLVIAVSFGGHLTGRHHLIEDHRVKIAMAEADLKVFANDAGRLAFWDGSPDDFLGEISFHFWGNYQYGRSRFDELLVDRYPGFTWLQLRDVRSMVAELESEERSAPTRHVGGTDPRRELRSAWWYRLGRRLFRSVVPRPALIATPGAGDIVAGESHPTQVGTIAFPEREWVAEVGADRLPMLLAVLERRFGTLDVQQRRIADVDWVVITVGAPW